jgi:hypothetical protein
MKMTITQLSAALSALSEMHFKFKKMAQDSFTDSGRRAYLEEAEILFQVMTKMAKEIDTNVA